MASWTDKAPTFNPYIQQQPVDAMVKVGMYKQQQYDEGIQKIQSSIDNVAGIDIIRDVDKQYLKTKLGQLQRKLGAVAGGDFSSTQLVNSVTGMTNSIIKDKYVTAAIQSTAIDRKNLQFMAEEKKKGNSNPANTEHYYKQRQAYMDAGLQGEDGDPVTFNGSYSQFFDIDKYVRETFNSLLPGGYSHDEIFQTDENGNRLIRTVTDAKTGKKRQEYILSETMTTLKKKGMFPERVEAAINNIFKDPRVSNQLQISGEYEYKGMTSDYLKEKITENKTQRIDAYDKKISELLIEKTILKDPEKQTEKQTQIDKITENKNREIQSFDKLIEASVSNPDYVRGQLYREIMKNTYNTMYTSVEEEMSISDSPAMNYKFKVQTLADANARHYEEMAWKQAEFNQRAEFFYAGEKSKIDIAKLKAGDGTNGVYNDTPTNAGVPSNYSHLKLGDDLLQNASTTWNNLTEELIFEVNALGKNEDVQRVIEAYKKEKPEWTLSQIKRKIIEDRAILEGYSDISAYKTKLIDDVMTKLNENGENLTISADYLKTAVENAKKELIRQELYNTQLDEEAPIKDVKSELSTFTINYEGEDLELTPELQYDFLLANSSEIRFDSAYGKTLIENAKERLHAKGFTDKDISMIVGGIGAQGQNNQDYIYGSPNWDADFVPQDPNTERFLHYANNASDETFFGENIEKREQKAKDIFVVNPKLRDEILTEDTGKNTKLRDKVQGILGFYKDRGINTAPDFLDNVNNMLNIAAKENSGSFELYSEKDDATGEIQSSIIFYDASTKKRRVGTVDITLEEAHDLNKYPENWYKSKDVRMVEDWMGHVGNGTTALNPDLMNPTIYKNGDAILEKGDFFNLTKIKQDVKANIRHSTTGQWFSYVYILHEGKSYIKQIQPQNTLQNTLQLLKGLEPRHIVQILKEEKPIE